MKFKLTLIILISLLLSGCIISRPQVSTDRNTPAPGGIAPSAGEIKPINNKLDLSNQGLTKVPERIFSQTDLEELNLSGNLLGGAIQAEIRQLKNLRILKVSNNLMTGVPAEIGQLEKLEILDLSNNRLTGLPYELGNLKNLKILNISGNGYSTLDLEIIVKKLPANMEIIK